MPDRNSADSETGVLASSEILRRKGEIFIRGFDATRVGPASYDLEIADVLLVNSTEVFDETHKAPPFSLQPGQAAFVSTTEQICMPLDLVGFISIRFSFAMRGVMILTGLVVDPGYGGEVKDETWSTGPGGRLHFLLANVGSEPVEIRPGADSVASIAFATLLGSPDIKTIPSHKELEARVFESHKAVPSIQLFRVLSMHQQETAATITGLENRLQSLQNEITTVTRTVDRVETGAVQVIQFGIWLLSATLLAGIVTTWLAWAGDRSLDTKLTSGIAALPTSWPQAVVLIAIIATLLTIAWAIGRILGRLFGWLTGRSRKRGSALAPTTPRA